MIRTQIYISKNLKKQLANLAIYKKENMSQLIREAIEFYIAHERNIQKMQKQSREQIFNKVFGMWKDNETDFKDIRGSGDRFL